MKSEINVEQKKKRIGKWTKYFMGHALHQRVWVASGTYGSAFDIIEKWVMQIWQTSIKVNLKVIPRRELALNVIVLKSLSEVEI